jgi:glyoxylase-like metal-dependent hydrolase (beta-lactamase superfamily II)
MPVARLAPGVWRIPLAPLDLLNAFLVEGADGSLTLVDAGGKRAPKKVLDALAGLGKAPGEVTHLLLSHAHSDHAGGARALQEATGGRVLAHEREAVYLREGRMPTPDGSTRAGRLLARAGGGRFAPVDPDETFVHGALLPLAGGLRVVHTPGHTPGHCSFLHTATGVLLVGDALFNVRGLRWSVKTPCTDIALSRASAARLAELDFDVAGFTHGSDVSTGARSVVRAFLAGRGS